MDGKIIPQDVRIEGIIGNSAPAWANGLTGRYNAMMGYIDIAHPHTKIHQVFDATAFRFSPIDDNQPQPPHQETTL